MDNFESLAVSVDRRSSSNPYYDHRERNQKVIKTCLKCGYTKKMALYVIECPDCKMVGHMGFFRDLGHIIRFINLYGVGNLRVQDSDVVEAILQAFQEV